MNTTEEKPLLACRVTYTVTHQGKFYIVNNVPAQVDAETGEQFFTPATVAHLQALIFGDSAPSAVITTPVYEYPESPE